MQIPSVVHPTKFAISGMHFEVVTLEPVSNEQAAKIAMHFYRNRKFKKADKAKLFRVVTLFNSNSASIL